MGVSAIERLPQLAVCQSVCGRQWTTAGSRADRIKRKHVLLIVRTRRDGVQQTSTDSARDTRSVDIPWNSGPRASDVMTQTTGSAIVGSQGTVFVYWGDHWYGDQDTTAPGQHNYLTTFVLTPLVSRATSLSMPVRGQLKVIWAPGPGSLEGRRLSADPSRSRRRACSRTGSTPRGSPPASPVSADITPAFSGSADRLLACRKYAPRGLPPASLGFGRYTPAFSGSGDRLLATGSTLRALAAGLDSEPVVSTSFSEQFLLFFSSWTRRCFDVGGHCRFGHGELLCGADGDRPWWKLG